MKGRQDAHGDHLMERFHRAKASFTGAWRCRGGEADFISPSLRGRGQKSKKEKAREKGDSQKVPGDPLPTKVRQPAAAVKSDRRLSLEGLSLEYRREGDSKKKGSPTNRGKTNGQLQPESQQGQDAFNPQGEKVEKLEERDAASLHTGLPKTNKGKEKIDTELDTVHSVGGSLQDLHHEIVEVGIENEASSSMHSAPEEDSQATDPPKTGRLKELDFRAFSPTSEIEEVGQASDILNSDSDSLRQAQDRKVEEEKRLHHSVDGVSEKKVHHGIERSESPRNQYAESKESPPVGRAGQNIDIPNSESRYGFQEAEGEKVKASEQNESPVSVLSGALGSRRWAEFDSANNTPHPPAGSKHEIEELESPSHHRQTDFSEFSDVAKPGKGIGTPKANSDGLQKTEEERLETPGRKESHHLVNGGLEQESKSVGLLTPENSKHLDATNSHGTGMDATEKMGGPADDHLAAFSEQGEAENKTEPNHPLNDIPEKESDGGELKPKNSEDLEQARKDGTEQLRQAIKETTVHLEQAIEEEMKHLEQTIKETTKNSKETDSTRPSHGIEHREGPSIDHEGEALNSDSAQGVQGKTMQDGLHEKQIQDGDLKVPQNDRYPTPEGLEELLTGNSDSKAAANGVHQDGTYDSYSKDKAGSPTLYGIAAAEKDDRASIYGTGYYLRYFVLGVAIVVAVCYLHYRQTLW